MKGLALCSARAGLKDKSVDAALVLSFLGLGHKEEDLVRRVFRWWLARSRTISRLEVILGFVGNSSSTCST